MKEIRDKVLAGYAELIQLNLESDQPYRFQAIIKLCKSAHELAKLGAIRVDDVVKGLQDGERGVAYDMDEGGIVMHPRRTHEMDGMREIIHQIGTLFEGTKKDSNDKLLDRLGRARDVLIDMGRPPESVAVIEAKIDEIVADMAQQEETDNALVPTELLRGHQAEGEGRRQLRAGSGAAHDDGEGGPPAVPEECSEEGMD